MKPENSKQKCLSDLRLQILLQKMPPGSDLDEKSLTETYSISRTPMREILQKLSGEGFVVIEENKGAKVASMDLKTMRVFFQTAPLIYSSIARLAAENRTDSQLSNLKSVQEKFRLSTVRGSASDAALFNHKFHEVIGEMAHNAYLMAALGRLLVDHTRMSTTFYHPDSEEESTLVVKACEQHDAMIQAIEEHEIARAAELTLEHWDLSRDQLERFVKPDPLPINVTQKKETINAV